MFSKTIEIREYKKNNNFIPPGIQKKIYKHNQININAVILKTPYSLLPYFTKYKYILNKKKLKEEGGFKNVNVCTLKTLFPHRKEVDNRLITGENRLGLQHGINIELYVIWVSTL